MFTIGNKLRAYVKLSDKILHFPKKMFIFEAERLFELKNTITFITMEDYKKSGMNESEKEIVFSQAIKAGKRIYYIDVKKNRKDEMYLSITESKKIVNGEGENATVTFEKHKIFLYREDFTKFANSLKEAIDFVVAEQGEYVPRYNENAEPAQESSTSIDIEF